MTSFRRNGRSSVWPAAHQFPTGQLASIRLSVDVVIRVCERGDLRKLEWEGIFRPHRRIIEAAFRRQERGQNVMLIAEAKGMPVGQVWIDLEPSHTEGAALIWAMRVVPWLQGYGIGTRLLEAALAISSASRMRAVQLTVDQNNMNAQRLYRRCGFKIVGKLEQFEQYVTCTGRCVRLRRPQLVMKKVLTNKNRTTASESGGDDTRGSEGLIIAAEG